MSAVGAMPRRAFRRHMVRIVIGALLLLPVGFFGVFALDAGGGTPVPASQRAVYAVLAAAFLVLAVRAFRIGVFTRPDGVVVRGVLRSRRLAWDEIERFEWGRWRGPGDFPCGVVRRRDGHQITVFALNPPFEITPGQDRRTPWLLAQLNEELGRAREIAPPDSGAPPDPHAPAGAHP